LVLGYHYINNLIAGSNQISKIVAKATSLGWSGVDLFFVLSGFLIGGILIKNKTSPKYFKTFYARRILRIFPLYYLILVIYIICKYSGFASESFSIFQYPINISYYFLYLQNVIMGVRNNFGPQFLTPTLLLTVEE
jgi:peptidoglycan/LPS O-acetylase OafA/YrhL